VIKVQNCTANFDSKQAMAMAPWRHGALLPSPLIESRISGGSTIEIHSILTMRLGLYRGLFEWHVFVEILRVIVRGDNFYVRKEERGGFLVTRVAKSGAITMMAHRVAY
jgi:hypothetical protein